MNPIHAAVITVVHGRHSHLIRQELGLARSGYQPADRWVVAIADPAIADLVSERSVVIEHASATDHLPLAAARNRGARHALDEGAELLIFLDVDCIPGASLVELYVDAHRRSSGPTLLCGPVTYLPESPEGYRIDALEHLAAPHPARPAPAPGDLVTSSDHDLFWSLSFAVSARTWHDIGGFCEDYVGYGGEDTDFAAVAAAKSIPVTWVGGAHAYHQHHLISNPPVEHIDAIIANAKVFRDRWGRWPMIGWLTAFQQAGLLVLDDDDIALTDRPGIGLS